MKLVKLFSVALGVAMLLGAVSFTSAATINMTFLGAAPLGGVHGTNVTFFYSVDLTGGSTVDPAQPAVVTLFDLDNFITGSSVYIPIGAFTFTDTEQLTGINPGITPTQIAFINAIDNPAVFNVSLTYTGPIFTAPSLTTLGFLELDSSDQFISGPLDYTVADKDMLTGGPEFSVTNTNGPATSGTPAVPAPASAWGGLALIALIGAVRARKAIRA